VEANGGRSQYFVLVYDHEALAVLSLSGHDFTGAVLTLTRRTQEHRHPPEVTVRLFARHRPPRPPARHAELFDRLSFPDG
jgi:hypothetical protein